MQLFNFEIRKLDGQNLLKEVDEVLAKNGMKSGEVTIDIANQAAAHSLQKMLKQKDWFDVSTLERCASVICKTINSNRMAIYNSQHCIHWSQMTDNFREVLIAMILDDFREIFLPKETRYEITQKEV